MKKKLKLYIAGPMTGKQAWNKPAFNKAAKFLAKHGYKPVNPAWLDHGKSGGKWEKYLKRDIPHMLKCDGICVLPGWDKSRGAKLEVRIARELGIPVYAIADKKKLVRVTMFPDNFIKFGPPIHVETKPIEPAILRVVFCVERPGAFRGPDLGSQN